MMRFKKIGVRILLIVFVAWLCVVGWGFVFAWRPLPTYSPLTAAIPGTPILTGSQYQLGHEEPFLVRADHSSGSGTVLVFGSKHTKDPNDPSLERIKFEFESFAPTVVLCEGRMTGLLFPGLMDPVKTFGEPGLVRKLAYANGCPVFTWEPSPRGEVEGLLNQSFDKKQIALRLMLSSYFGNLRFGKPDDPDEFVNDTIRKKKSWPEIGNLFADVTELDLAWASYFPDGPDWRDVSDEQTLPGFLGEMDANLVRDAHLFSIIHELVERGERVFVIAGSSHAVKLEGAVTSINLLEPVSKP